MLQIRNVSLSTVVVLNHNITNFCPEAQHQELLDQDRYRTKQLDWSLPDTMHHKPKSWVATATQICRTTVCTSTYALKSRTSSRAVQEGALQSSKHYFIQTQQHHTTLFQACNKKIPPAIPRTHCWPPWTSPPHPVLCSRPAFQTKHDPPLKYHRTEFASLG